MNRSKMFVNMVLKFLIRNQVVWKEFMDVMNAHTKTEDAKLLMEKLIGGCWHEWHPNAFPPQCLECGHEFDSIFEINPTFNNETDYTLVHKTIIKK